MPSEREMDRLSRQIEATAGHPGKLWDDLQGRIQAEAIKLFADVESDWLRLMWSIDAFRIAGVPPLDMGDQKLARVPRLQAVYRTKGNWFATLLALLLQNRTLQRIQPRIKVQGFSQVHQIDLAWPPRDVDPLVCAEAKVTGAPAYGETPSRSALSDFSNRRKELKFAATDLKLYRRQQETSIQHWDVWRTNAPPKTYFLWAARLRTDKQPDDIRRLIQEAQDLVNTYFEGAAVMAWRESTSNAGYESIPIPQTGRITKIDDVLYRIESEISQLTSQTGTVPPPVIAEQQVVDPKRLTDDDQ